MATYPNTDSNGIPNSFNYVIDSYIYPPGISLPPHSNINVPSDLLKNPMDYFLQYINAQNGVMLNSDSVELKAYDYQDTVTGTNSILEMTPKPGSTLTGKASIKYNRLNLADVFNGFRLPEASTALTIYELLPTINKLLSSGFSSFDIVDGPLPPFNPAQSNARRTVLLVAKQDSLMVYGSTAIELAPFVPEFNLVVRHDYTFVQRELVTNGGAAVTFAEAETMLVSYLGNNKPNTRFKFLNNVLPDSLTMFKVDRLRHISNGVFILVGLFNFSYQTSNGNIVAIVPPQSSIFVDSRGSVLGSFLAPAFRANVGDYPLYHLEDSVKSYAFEVDILTSEYKIVTYNITGAMIREKVYNPDTNLAITDVNRIKESQPDFIQPLYIGGTEYYYGIHNVLIDPILLMYESYILLYDFTHTMVTDSAVLKLTFMGTGSSKVRDLAIGGDGNLFITLDVAAVNRGLITSIQLNGVEVLEPYVPQIVSVYSYIPVIQVKPSGEIVRKFKPVQHGIFPELIVQYNNPVTNTARKLFSLWFDKTSYGLYCMLPTVNPLNGHGSMNPYKIDEGGVLTPITNDLNLRIIAIEDVTQINSKSVILKAICRLGTAVLGYGVPIRTVLKVSLNEGFHVSVVDKETSSFSNTFIKAAIPIALTKEV